ncbi:MAG: glycosyltransferase family 4 protein [Ruminococcaceae bacterium]|nr:glycosyltransferase family 4 protein [Oscillospiraceae bacterium]
MKIQFDGNPLCDGYLTGIGTYESELCRRMVARHPEDEFEYVYFALRGKSTKKGIMAAYEAKNASAVSFSYLSAGLYKLIQGVFPLPYSFMFGRKNEVTHFFNFLIPPGVKGKRVVTIHDLGFIRYPETVTVRTRLMLRARLRRTIERSDRIIVVSEFTARELTELYGVPREKMSVVYCGVDTEKFKNKEYKGRCSEILKEKGLKDKGYFLYLGTIEPRKNIYALVGAYAKTVKRLVSEGKEAYPLVLAGKLGWYYDKILERIKTEGIEERIILTGYLSEYEKICLYSRARAFVFPSLYEGFGIPVLEAMACGAPVLTSNAASLPEVAGDAALICDPESEEEISEEMYALATDSGLCQRLVQAGFLRAKAFSWEKEADKLYDIYKTLLPGEKDE